MKHWNETFRRTMNDQQNSFIGLMLQGIFYGLYCVIFVLYLRIQLQRKHEPKGLLVYALGVNFMLCTAYLAVGMVQFLQSLLGDSSSDVSLTGGADTLYTCIDFVSQGILLYRCWIMWRRPLIIIVPVLLSLACLGTALTALVFQIKAPLGNKYWWNSAVVAFFSISLVVNAVVTGLIVLKIALVRRDLHFMKACTSCVCGTGPRYFYPIISMLIESSVITFVAQLVQTILWQVDASAFSIVSGVVVQLYGISPTVVLVRVAIGLAYDNETSNILPSQAIRFAEAQSNDTTTLEITGNDLLDKHSPSRMTQDVSS